MDFVGCNAITNSPLTDWMQSDVTIVQVGITLHAPKYQEHCSFNELTKAEGSDTITWKCESCVAAKVNSDALPAMIKFKDEFN